MCKKLQEEKKILAGGPASGAVMHVLIVSAESVQGLDDVITSLPLWSRMETEVTPLTSFEGRKLTLRSRLEQLRAQVRNLAEKSAA
jgi:muconolactone delta-isomerase